MKIEQLIVQYLFSSKEVTLQGIGTFKLSPEVGLPTDDEKEFFLPENAVSFEQNIKAIEDSRLIDFMWEKTQKLKSLLSSDVESFISNGKQFLNIGNPFSIVGLGTLIKAQDGSYTFFAGNFVQPKIESPDFLIKEKLDDDNISFRSEAKRHNQKINPKLIVGIVSIVVLLAIAWMIFHKKNNVPDKSITTIENSNITDKALPGNNNTPLLTDSAKIINQGEYAFKVVVREYKNYIDAKKSFSTLSSYGHRLILYTNDSITYKLAMPFNNPLRDTVLIKDSLKRYNFGGNPYIEMH